jgi:hypothetical protein
VGLVVLMLLLNTAMLTGHSSTESVMSFPKNDLRDLKGEAERQAKYLAYYINHDVNLTSNESRLAAFNESYDRYIGDVNAAYVSRGAVVEISYMAYAPNSTIEYAVVNVSYDNGNTKYKENMWPFFR